jgi:HAD superfamily hydrolase (TIGR01490 family)
VIREAFAGKRVVLSGVTGFLGTGLLERLLTDSEVARIDCVARGDAHARVRNLLTGMAFGPARERLGEDELFARFDRVVRVLPADLTVNAPAIDDDVDLVIHSAATVSFDPPIDEAFATNLLGSVRLYEAAAGKPFIHVSTAYVAGLTRGLQAEELLVRDADWRAEAEGALAMRALVEEESRRPEALERFVSRARAKAGRAGPQSVAEAAEAMRRDWVKKRLVRAGAARARSLGWPDVYAFTKALTEKALDELAGDNPLTIVRPSIIESAFRHPYPGWIEGFRVAEPVILAFGRGALPEFPGIPEGVLDIIPVDMVVNCILAAAARPLERRRVFHISSGGRNPLTFRKLYELTREYFLEHPLPERGRGTYKVPEWSFPGRRAVEKRLRFAERAVETAERVAARLPRTAAAREIAQRVDRMRGRVDFVRRYATLYGAYVETEVIYTDHGASALHDAMPEADREDFGFDPAAFSWQRYLKEVHLPAISMPLRFFGGTAKRPEPAVSIVPATPNGHGMPVVIAAFDVEGTIVDSNVIEAYLWLRMSETSGVGRARAAAHVARNVPSLLAAERRDRGEFLRMFYRQYAGASADEVRALARESLGELFVRRLSSAAVRRIRRHREAGHRIVFITGSLDFVIEPLAQLADTVVTARLREEDGVFTGDMERPPLVGEARASWLREEAKRLGADLAHCYAYADSMSDLPMLRAVGNPVAVNPDVSLARIARTERWPIEAWRPSGAPKLLLPEEVVAAR